MKLSISIALAILSYCASVSAVVIPGPTEVVGQYTEAEHQVAKAHPHFGASAAQNKNPDYDPFYGQHITPENSNSGAIFKDAWYCGQGGTPFDFRHPEQYSLKDVPVLYNRLLHFHIYTTAPTKGRVKGVQIENAHEGRHGNCAGGCWGDEPKHSPLDFEKYPSNWIVGQTNACCRKKNKGWRVCYLAVYTKYSGSDNNLYAGTKQDIWRSSRPACCKAFSIHGKCGAELDAIGFYWFIRGDYYGQNKELPGWDPSPARRKFFKRHDFEVGAQSNLRARSTEVLGHFDVAKHELIDHSEHIADHYRISHIVAYCSDRVEGIQLTYRDLNDETKVRQSVFHGKKIGQLREIEFHKGDYGHALDLSPCSDPETGRSQVCGLVIHAYSMQQFACGRSTKDGEHQFIDDHAMLNMYGTEQNGVLKSIGFNWIPVQDHH